MAFNYSPKIITDGLVLYLDAANTKSYVSGSTSWNDISRGGNNGTLTNGPTFSSANGGSIVFDGTNDYVAGTGPSLSGSAFTIAVWIKPTTAPSNETYFSIGAEEGTNLTIHLRLVNDTTIRFGLYADDFVTTINTVTGNWNYIVCSLDSLRLQSIYQNSILRGTRTSTGMFIGNNLYIVGAWRIPGIVQYTDANIASVQVYNRALSATEITQNFNATKTRFGI